MVGTVVSQKPRRLVTLGYTYFIGPGTEIGIGCARVCALG